MLFVEKKNINSIDNVSLQNIFSVNIFLTKKLRD